MPDNTNFLSEIAQNTSNPRSLPMGSQQSVLSATYNFNRLLNNGSKNLFKNNSELTPEDEIKIKELKELDGKVRKHEQAHLRAAQSLARSGTIFQYEKGPDGKLYAVHGEVIIDTKIDDKDPEEMLKKAKQIEQAALAPHDPSATDLQVVTYARKMQAKAQAKIWNEKTQELILDRLEKDDPNQDQFPGIKTYQKTRDYLKTIMQVVDMLI